MISLVASKYDNRAPQKPKQSMVEVAEDALSSAHELRKLNLYRSSVSRSYYSAYSFLAAALVLKAGVNFRDDREGPEHEPLSDLVGKHLKNTFAPSVIIQIRNGVRTLYKERLNADYHPRASVREDATIRSLQTATTIANNVRKFHP